MFASLQKSLELIAARIPAQSMQSFMPMVIAGFDNSDTNTAYVSTSQIWLQGSDFDIDTATFTRYAVGKDGSFIHWSSLANINSYELLKASDKLPFPTGNSEVETKYVNDETLVVYNPASLFISILNEESDGFRLNDSTPQHIEKIAELIEFINKNGTYGLRVVTESGEEKMDPGI
jgi:hypothetical protein